MDQIRLDGCVNALYILNDLPLVIPECHFGVYTPILGLY